MIAAVKDLPQEILDKIEYREWSLRTVEGAARFRELKGRSLPALAIDDRLAFQSEIPPQEQLIREIELAGRS